MIGASQLRGTLAAGFAVAAFLSAFPVVADSGSAKGSIGYKAKSGAITISPRFAYVVKGPDAVDSNKIIRHIILSPTDLGAKINACKTMSCTDADLDSGMTIDLDAGPRLNYWVVANGQRVQYSGTEQASSLKLTTETATRIAGKLSFDAAAMGGPQVAVEFDAPVVSELEQAR